jgi:chromosome partitioning protein
MQMEYQRQRICKECLMITTILSTKGGSGKSMLAINLAVAAAESGASVLLIDTDPQAALAMAFATRETTSESLSIYPVAFKHITDDALFDVLVHSLADFDEVYIDTVGFDCARVWRIAAESDLIVVPVAAGMADVNVTAEVATKLMHLQNGGCSLQARCIRTNYQARTRIASTIAANLAFFKDSLPELQHLVSRRTIYADAFSYGVGVMEYDPRSAAAKEIKELYTELLTNFSC